MVRAQVRCHLNIGQLSSWSDPLTVTIKRLEPEEEIEDEDPETGDPRDDEEPSEDDGSEEDAGSDDDEEPGNVDDDSDIDPDPDDDEGREEVPNILSINLHPYPD